MKRLVLLVAGLGLLSIVAAGCGAGEVSESGQVDKIKEINEAGKGDPKADDKGDRE